MNIASTIPQPSEKLIALAGTWADLFCKSKPGLKQMFIDHYVNRAVVRRFWSDSGEINGRKIAACRLGDNLMLVFYQGQIHKLPIKGSKTFGLNIPNGGIGPTKHMARFLSGLQRKLESGVKYDSYSLDALTSFSRQASKEISDTLYGDIPKFIGVRPQAKKNRYAGFYSVTYKKYTGRYGNALKHFLSHVDQDVLFAIRSLRCPSISLYNWLSSGDSQRRMQAARAFPVLVPLEVVLGKVGASLHLTDLTNLVDQGDSITPLLAGIYKTTPSVMKKLGKLSPYTVGSALTHLKYRFDRDEFLLTIKAFKLGSKRPQTSKGWNTCIRVMSSTDIDLTESNLAGMPAWESPDWGRLQAEIRNLYDIGVIRLLLAKRSIKRALSFSVEWHEKRTLVQRALLETGKYSACSWPGMLKEGVVHPETGLSFVEIVDDLSLAYEGEVMGHCVGGYSGYCFDGVSRIISIRDGDKSLATLEYRLEISKTGRRSFSCSQAQGPGNRSFAGTPADKAFKWFTKNFRSFVKTYDIPPVPSHLRPSAQLDLSQAVRTEMKGWIDSRIEQLGYAEELIELQAELNKRYHYEEEYDD